MNILPLIDLQAGSSILPISVARAWRTEWLLAPAYGTPDAHLRLLGLSSSSPVGWCGRRRVFTSSMLDHAAERDRTTPQTQPLRMANMSTGLLPRANPSSPTHAFRSSRPAWYLSAFFPSFSCFIFSNCLRPRKNGMLLRRYLFSFCFRLRETSHLHAFMSSKNEGNRGFDFCVFPRVPLIPRGGARPSCFPPLMLLSTGSGDLQVVWS